MLSLPKLMEEYIKETKGKMNFNMIPEQVIHYSKEIHAIDIDISYQKLTHKDSSEKTQAEMINEMIFLLLKHKREAFL